MICENCSAEMQRSIEGSTLMWSCPSCGDAMARTYIEPIREDTTSYTLALDGEAKASKDTVRVVAGIAGCNYLTAKRLIEAGGGSLMRGQALRIRDAARELRAVSLPYAIDPDFPYEIDG